MDTCADDQLCVSEFRARIASLDHFIWLKKVSLSSCYHFVTIGSHRRDEVRFMTAILCHAANWKFFQFSESCAHQFLGGQEHNGSSVAATELQPSGGVPLEGWQGETKSTSRAPCVSNGVLASTTLCSVRSRRTRRLQYNRHRCSHVQRSCWQRKRYVQDHTQFRHRVIGLVFQQWRALLLGVFGPLTERLTVELWAKKKQTGVICLSGSQSCSVCCDGRVVQKSCWNGCDLVLSATEDDLLRELDRPSALWISVPEEPTPATFLLFWSSGSSLTRCAPSSLVSMQKCVPAVNPTCADSALECEVCNVSSGWLRVHTCMSTKET